jgi:ATP-dependent helicase/nuclease subunit B
MWESPCASGQVAALQKFIGAHERLPASSDDWHSRHLRARGAILGALGALAEAHSRHDDDKVPFEELAGTVRRWIEGQTFSPRTGDSGITLLDAPAAAYADADEIRLVGLVDSDWPDRNRRSIFYPSSLLAQLGWPVDADRLSAARARFHDLLRLARQRVAVSLFTLEDDAIVPASSFLEELEIAGLPIERFTPARAGRVFLHEALAEEPLAAAALSGEPLEWLAMRASRSPAAGAMFHGEAGTRDAGVYAVSRVERYLECPFKYFAAHVLKLPEDRDEESGLSAQERGQFLHEVFEEFFTRWQAAGNGSITTGNVADALAMFEEVADAQLATLGESDRAVERTHLLGSAAAPGLAERAFTFEIERGGEVIERLLEHELEGGFVFNTAAGPRTVRLRAKADRIDLLADGSLRVIDYKLGKAPKASRALQLPVYGVCAEQSLAGRHGRAWTLGEAGYVAFREKNAFVELGASSSLKEAVNAGQDRFLAAIDGIERGEFPPAPDEPFICTRCGYASVCRKDYVGDE